MILRDIFKNRLKELMNYYDLRQIDISNKTGLDKSLISCYLSGKYEATQDNVFLIAESYGIDPAWLMGFDVPMKKIDYDEVDKMYLNNIDKLTDNDKSIIKTIIQNRINGDKHE